MPPKPKSNSNAKSTPSSTTTPTPTPTDPTPIPGISYTQSFTKTPHYNSAALAGALNLPSTSALWDLYSSPTSAAKPILTSWTAERTQYKDVITLRGVRDTTLLALAADPAFHVYISSDMHPAFNVVRNKSSPNFKLRGNGKNKDGDGGNGNSGKGGKGRGKGKGKGNANANANGTGAGAVTGTNLVYLAGLWYIGRLVRACPALFPRSRVPLPLAAGTWKGSSDGDGDGDPNSSARASARAGAGAGIQIDPYDVLHEWKLLKWAWAVAYPAAAAGEKKKVKDKPATKPVWHVQPKREDQGSGGVWGGGAKMMRMMKMKQEEVEEDEKMGTSDVVGNTENQFKAVDGGEGVKTESEAEPEAKAEAEANVKAEPEPEESAAKKKEEINSIINRALTDEQDYYDDEADKHEAKKVKTS